MPVIPMRPAKRVAPRTELRNKRVYAIAFDLDTKVAESLCGSNYHYCYTQIKMVLGEHGFTNLQGSVYFGDAESDAVKCVVAVQDLDRRFSWFGRSVRDLRMLRVEENNDLRPALSNQLRLDRDSAA